MSVSKHVGLALKGLCFIFSTQNWTLITDLLFSVFHHFLLALLKGI